MQQFITVRDVATMYAKTHVHTTCQPKLGSSWTNYLSSAPPVRRYDYCAYIPTNPGYAPDCSLLQVVSLVMPEGKPKVLTSYPVQQH